MSLFMATSLGRRGPRRRERYIQPNVDTEETGNEQGTLEDKNNADSWDWHADESWWDDSG